MRYRAGIAGLVVSLLVAQVLVAGCRRAMEDEPGEIGMALEGAEGSYTVDVDGREVRVALGADAVAETERPGDLPEYPGLRVHSASWSDGLYAAHGLADAEVQDVSDYYRPALRDTGWTELPREGVGVSGTMEVLSYVKDGKALRIVLTAHQADVTRVMITYGTEEVLGG